MLGCIGDKCIDPQGAKVHETPCKGVGALRAGVMSFALSCLARAKVDMVIWKEALRFELGEGAV